MEENKKFKFTGFHYVKGMPFLFNTTKENIERIRNWSLHKDDLIVATYPKNGTVLTETILAAILESGDLDGFRRDGYKYKRAPIEFDRVFEEVSTGIRPCIIHTHLRYDMLPLDVDKMQVKVINVMRNPKDVAVSYYHHCLMEKNFGPYNGTWDEFFEIFLTGQVPWGSWFDYNKHWIKYIDQPNILHIKYEELVSDRSQTIRRLAKFVNKELSDVTIGKIAEVTTIDSMRNNPKLDMTYPAFDQTKGSFLRKGKIGDWKNYFSQEQNARITRLYEQFSKETGLTFTFE